VAEEDPRPQWCMMPPAWIAAQHPEIGGYEPPDKNDPEAGE
jgi:hypothetical protein